VCWIIIEGQHIIEASPNFRYVSRRKDDDQLFSEELMLPTLQPASKRSLKHIKAEAAKRECQQGKGPGLALWLRLEQQIRIGIYQKNLLSRLSMWRTCTNSVLGRSSFQPRAAIDAKTYRTRFLRIPSFVLENQKHYGMAAFRDRVYKSYWHVSALD
jgi:hypothetical protein